jgi:hypothetical protein
MMELNQRLYELIVNIANHAPTCDMMIAFLRGKPALEEHCTCWKKEAIQIIEQIDAVVSQEQNI